jgi:hypothetical protein
MHDDHSTHANDGEPNAADSGVETPRETIEGIVTPRRRTFLKTLSLPPLAGALAGCQLFETEEDPFGTDIGPAPTTNGPPETTEPPGGTDDITAETLAGLEPGGTIRFSDAIEFRASYGIDVRSGGEGETRTRLTGRTEGSDHFHRIERGNTVARTRVFDGIRYDVTAEDCVSYELGGETPEDPETDGSDPALILVDTTTIDDREAMILELPADEREVPNLNVPEGTDIQGPEDPGAIRYAVRPETGRPRRIETASTVVDYGSWDAVDSIEPPDRECSQETMPDPAPSWFGLPGDVIENAVDELEVVDHASGAGSPGLDSFDRNVFYVTITLKNDRAAETDLLNYAFDVAAIDEDGEDLSSGENSIRALTELTDEAVVAPGAAGTVVVAPDLGTDSGGSTTPPVAGYEISVGCGESTEAVYCGESPNSGCSDTGFLLGDPDGTLHCVAPIQGDQPVTEYYGFDTTTDKSAVLPDELMAQDATVTFVYRNTTTGDRSLVIVHDAPASDTGGAAVMETFGTSGAEWLVQDDPPENDDYATPDGSIDGVESAAWSWPGGVTDGGVIGPLGETFEVALTHRSQGVIDGASAERSGLDRWLFVDGANLSTPIELAAFADDDPEDVSAALFTSTDTT